MRTVSILSNPPNFLRRPFFFNCRLLVSSEGHNSPIFLTIHDRFNVFSRFQSSRFQASRPPQWARDGQRIRRGERIFEQISKGPGEKNSWEKAGAAKSAALIFLSIVGDVEAGKYGGETELEH